MTRFIRRLFTPLPKGESTADRRKAAILRAVMVIAALLLLFLILSRHIRSMMLPQVQQHYIQRGSLTNRSYYHGVLATQEDEDAESVTAADNWRITEVFAGEGDAVSRGDALFAVDMTDAETQRMTLALEILRLENSLAALGDTAAASPLKSETLTAPFAGKLLETPMITAGREITRGAALGRIVDDSAFVITAVFSTAYRAQVEPGQVAEVTLPQWMEVLPGTVSAVRDVDIVTEAGTRAFEADIVVSNLTPSGGPGALREGDAALVSLAAGNGERVLATEPGVLRYARDTALTAPMSGIVKETKLSVNTRCANGGLLLRVEEAPRETENTGSADAAKDRTRAELNAQLALSRRKLTLLGRSYPADGVVYAGRGGVVLSIAKPGLVGAGQTAAVITAGEPDYIFRTAVSFQDMQMLLQDDYARLSCAISTLTESESGEAEVQLLDYQYREDSGRYDCVFAVSAPKLEEGLPVSLTISASSGSYFLIPRGNVFTDGTTQYVWTLTETQDAFGLVYAVSRCNVTLEDSNNMYDGVTFVSREPVVIAVFPSTPLQDGAEVRVMNP